MKQDWSARASRRAHGSTNDIEELDQCPVIRRAGRTRRRKRNRLPPATTAFVELTLKQFDYHNLSKQDKTPASVARSGAELPSGTDRWLGSDPWRAWGRV